MGSDGEAQTSSLSTDFKWDSSPGFGWATQGLSHSSSEAIPALLWLYAWGHCQDNVFLLLIYDDWYPLSQTSTNYTDFNCGRKKIQLHLNTDSQPYCSLEGKMYRVEVGQGTSETKSCSMAKKYLVSHQLCKFSHLKIWEACNFHHRYTSTMTDKMRKKNPENHIVGFLMNLFANYGGK